MQYTVAPLVFFAAFTATAGTAAHYYLNGTGGMITGKVATALGADGQPISGATTPEDNGADDVGFDVGAAADAIPGITPGSVMTLIPGLALGMMTGTPMSPFGALPIGSRRNRKDRDGGDLPRGGGSQEQPGGGGTTCRGPACGNDNQKCFAGDTLVVTAEGLVPIADLEPEDRVLTRSAPDQPVVERAITAVYETPGAPILEIWVAEDNQAPELIETTPGHPFWVEEAGWVDSDQLAPGDRLSTADGDAASVTSVASTSRRETVYNLQVEEHHTYFVGQTETWVHNTPGECDDQEGPPANTPKRTPAQATQDMIKDPSPQNITNSLVNVMPANYRRNTTIATASYTDADGKVHLIVATSADCFDGKQAEALSGAQDGGVVIDAVPGMPAGMSERDPRGGRGTLPKRAKACNSPATTGPNGKNAKHAEMRAVWALIETLYEDPKMKHTKLKDVVAEIAVDKRACQDCSDTLQMMGIVDVFTNTNPGPRSGNTWPSDRNPREMTIEEVYAAGVLMGMRGK